MIKGEFDNHGRPIVRATFSCGLSRIPIATPFLIDTGAVSTIIMPSTSIKLQIDFSHLGQSVPINGTGGTIRGYQVRDATIALVDRGSLYSFITEVRIIDPAEQPNLQFPSILGCSMWSQWGLTIYKELNLNDIDPRKPPDSL